jgi:hypothetical protein
MDLKIINFFGLLFALAGAIVIFPRGLHWALVPFDADQRVFCN